MYISHKPSKTPACLDICGRFWATPQPTRDLPQLLLRVVPQHGTMNHAAHEVGEVLRNRGNVNPETMVC